MGDLYAEATKGSAPRQSLNDFRRELSAKRRGVEPRPPELPTVAAPPAASQGEQYKSLLDSLARLTAA